MKKIVIVFFLSIGILPKLENWELNFTSFVSCYSQCGGASSGEEQHSGGIGGSFDLNQTYNDFAGAYIEITNPPSTDPNVLGNEIFQFLNQNVTNPYTNPDYVVQVHGSLLHIGDMSTNQWFIVGIDLARYALAYYDQSRSTIINLDPYTNPQPVINHTPCGSYYTSYDPWTSINNPFNSYSAVPPPSNTPDPGGGNIGYPPATLSPEGPCPTDADVIVSTSLLRQISPTINRGVADIISNHINTYKDLFGVSGRKELAYFLAQAVVETDGFRKFEENHKYLSRQSILKNFSKYFPDPTLADNYINCTCLFDKVYANRFGNGNEASQDGSKYLGKGMIHLTFKGTYQSFTNYYQSHFGSSLDFVINPNLLRDDLEIAVISALWYFGIEKRKSTRYEKNIKKSMDADDVDQVSRIVNGGDNKLRERQQYTQAIKLLFCL